MKRSFSDTQTWRIRVLEVDLKDKQNFKLEINISDEFKESVEIWAEGTNWHKTGLEGSLFEFLKEQKLDHLVTENKVFVFEEKIGLKEIVLKRGGKLYFDGEKTYKAEGVKTPLELLFLLKIFRKWAFQVEVMGRVEKRKGNHAI